MKRILSSILFIGVLSMSACGAPTTAPEAEFLPTEEIALPSETPPTSAPTEQLSAPTTPLEEKELPPYAITWDEAKYHIGERTTVCGFVVDTKWASDSEGKPTFLNIGKPYPDPDRFTVVIWNDYRANFPSPPEVYYKGKALCVTGLITEYKGGSEIEVKDPSQIQFGFTAVSGEEYSLGYTDNTSQMEQVLVVRVIDGDTIELTDGRRVRYLGIDAPEVGEPYASEATAKNKQLVEGKIVELQQGNRDKDENGRLLRYVYINGVFVNAELVAQGYATTYIFDPDERYSQVLVQLEQYAKMRQQGLWEMD